MTVETECEPARTVEKEAAGRLGRRAAGSGALVEHAAAVRMPAALREVPASELADRVEDTVREFAALSAASDGAGRDRFPARGWLRGGLDDLAGLIENLGVSERAIAASTGIPQTAVRRAAGIPALPAHSLADSRPDPHAAFRDPGLRREVVTVTAREPQSRSCDSSRVRV